MCNLRKCLIKLKNKLKTMIITNPEIFNLTANNIFSVDFENDTTVYFIEGVNALNNVIGTTGVPREYAKITFVYTANAVGGTVQLLGANMPQQLLDKRQIIDAYYVNGAWCVSFNLSSATSGTIVDSIISANAEISMDKLETLAINKIPELDANGKLRASAVDTSALTKLNDLNLPASDYNKVGAFTGSTANLNRVAGGTWTANELEFLSGLIANAQIQLNGKASISAISGLLDIRKFDVTIPAAQVLTLNTSPITLVNAQGANTIIVPISIVGELIFNTTPYATNGEIDVFNGGNRQIFTLPPDNGFLFANGNRIVNAIPVLNQTITDNQYVKNSPLTITAGDSNPTAGDSDIRLIGLYHVLNL